MSEKLDPIPVPVKSLLARLYLERETRWRNFIRMHVPEARLLRWGAEHRVFRCGLRVMKIEWAVAASRDQHLSLEYEFSLLESLEGRALLLNPSYRVIDGAWNVLEMDWIEGEDLDVLIREGNTRKVSILQLIGRVIQVSLAGVIYKQLRARHIIRRANGELVFIDFGGSSRANPLVALWRNIAPLSSTGGSWQAGRLLGILHGILRHRYSAAVQQPLDATLSLLALQRWRINERMPSHARPDHLANHPGDALAARHFEAMEKCLTEAIEAEPRIGQDFITFQFADYGMAGIRDWGFVWDHLARRVDFAGKSVDDLACGMGGVGAFARLDGATRVVSCDCQPVILDAARHFAEALGFADNAYHLLDWVKLETGAVKLPGADIVTALSARLDILPRERLLDILTRYPEILWQTADAEAGRRDIEARGYRTVEILVRAGVGQHILYATDRVT